MVDERFTGAEAIISIPEGNDIPVSNVSWDREVEQTDIQQTATGSTGSSALKPTHAITGLRYSGSFEYDGKNEDLRSQLWLDNDEPVRATMTVKEEPGRGTDGASRTTTFVNVLITGESRDIPSDDVGSTTWDWVAEDMIVSEN